MIDWMKSSLSGKRKVLTVFGVEMHGLGMVSDFLWSIRLPGASLRHGLAFVTRDFVVVRHRGIWRHAFVDGELCTSDLLRSGTTAGVAI
jgi:hypothetical protein